MTFTLTRWHKATAWKRACDMMKSHNNICSSTVAMNGEENVLRLNYVGQLAEVAFSCLSGLPLAPIQPSGGDPGYDFDMDGMLVDVKASDQGPGVNRHPRLNLIMPQYKVNAGLKADAYVLAVVEENDVDFRGWISRDGFLAACEPLPIKVPAYKVDSSQLDGLETMLYSEPTYV